jgi:hypothetical protein
MTAQIATFVKGKLQPVLPFIDKFGGLVAMLVYQEETADGGTVEKRFPVSHDTNAQDCLANNNQREFVPDGSNYNGIAYLENQSLTVGGSTAGGTQYTASLRFVCWYNSEKITGVAADDQLLTQLIDRIQRTLTASIWNSAPFSRIRVVLRDVLVRDRSIFGAFTYSEAETQYLMPPFDYFAVDMTINFVVPRACVPALTLNPAECL